MNEHYEKLLQTLHIVRWELKERNDIALNLCIKYIQDAIVEAGRFNAQYTNLYAEYNMLKSMTSFNSCDTADDWCED
jgi:hypothetical protein